MAEARHSAKTCSICGETKPHTAFRTKGTQCRRCCSTRQVILNRQRIGTLRGTREGRERIRRYKRNYEAKLVDRGLTVNGLPRQKPYVSAAMRKARLAKDGYEWLAAHNARQAWSWWLTVKAPGWWMREAYRDRPWRNPRLTDAESWRIQYWCDPVFRAKQIEKVQRTKIKRRAQIDATDDGTLTGDVIVALFATAKCCAYCGKPMRSVEKSLDHVTPLSRGGAHSVTNVVVACKPCNFSKHTRMLDEWIGRAA